MSVSTVGTKQNPEQCEMIVWACLRECSLGNRNLLVAQMKKHDSLKGNYCVYVFIIIQYRRVSQLVTCVRSLVDVLAWCVDWAAIGQL